MSTPAFALDTTLEAHSPPEARGLSRDEVRMLVATPGRLQHRQVRDLPSALHPGDLLVVNTSATLPAAVRTLDGALVHVSTELDDGDWVVEVRQGDNRGPGRVRSGDVLWLPDGLALEVRRAHPAGQSRLWRVEPSRGVDRVGFLAAHGGPIEYAYLEGDWPLSDRQNVYAAVPGSAEMASAGRPLSQDVLVRLMARGIVVAPIVLHTGVSSQEKHEPPQPEPFVVPEATARLVNSAREVGRRVVAVGTTVCRTLESVADPAGRVHPAAGWTSLVLGPDRPARAVDGLLTGLHEAQASHLQLLRAVAGPELVRRTYDEVTNPAPGGPRYLWHEFGDTMLFLP